MPCGQDKFTTDVYVVNGQIIDIDACNDDQFIDKAHGTVTILDGGRGYAKGCFYSRDNLNGTTTVFINEGDETSCDFNSFTGGTGAGNVTAAANIADNVVVRGDGGGTGIQGSNVILDDSDNFLGALSFQAAAPTGSAFFRLLDNTTTNEPTINTYQGDPNTFVTAQAGSLMLDQDGAAWINTDGTNTGWQMLMVGGGTVTGTGVAGQVAFWDSPTNIAGDNDLFWDNTNTRLGIKTNTPTEDVSLLGDFHMTGHAVMGAYFNGFDLNNTAYADRILYLADNFTTTGSRGIELFTGFIPSAATDEHIGFLQRTGVSKLTFAYEKITGFRSQISSQNNSGGTSLIGYDAYIEHTPSGGTVGEMIGLNVEFQKPNALSDVTAMYGTYFVRPMITGIASTTQVFGHYVEDLSAMDGGAKYAFFYDFGAGTVINEDGLIGINTANPQALLHAAGSSNTEFMRLEGTTETVGVYMGTINPNGAINAGGKTGSLFMRTTGQVYVNTDGATAWSQLGAGGSGVTGSGTATQVAFWDSATSISGDNDLWFDQTNTRLGIGTNAPTATLHVNGDGLIDGHLAIGNAAVAPTANFILRMTEDTSGNGKYRFASTGTYNPVAGTDIFDAFEFDITIDDANAVGFTRVNGLTIFLNNNNAVNSTDMLGYTALMQHDGGGSSTLDRMIGYKVQSAITTGATVTEQFGFFFQSPTIPIGHTGTTYAFFAGDMTSKPGTNYAFYYDGLLPTVIDQQGMLGINTATPTAPLHVYNGVTDNVIMQRIEWNTADIGFWGGSINPNGVVDVTGDSAAGSLYFRSTGQIYVNTDGAMAWTEISGGGGGGVTGSGVATRIAFWDSATSLSSDADLYWDNTNKRLGINTTTPSTLVEISGSTTEGLTLAGHMMLGTVTAGSPVDPNAIIFVDEDFLSGFTGNFIFQQTHLQPASGGDLWVNEANQVLIDDDATFGFATVKMFETILINNNGNGGTSMYGVHTLVQQNGGIGSTVSQVYGHSIEVSIGAGGNASDVFGLHIDHQIPFSFAGNTYAIFIEDLADTTGTNFAFYYATGSPTVIDVNGYLGINTSTPGAPIEISQITVDDTIGFKMSWFSASIGFYGGVTNPNGVLDVTGLSGAGSLYFDASAALVYINTDGATTWSAFSMGGNSGWTDSGAIVELTTATDNVSIGTSSSFAKLTVVGDTNSIQFVLRANATQTANIFEVQDDVGATIVSLGAAGHWVPGTDDLQDLGADTFRWRDLYVGGATIHIGASTADEGMMSYTAGVLDFSTDATTNGDISFFTDDLYIDKTSGFIGINTTSPTKALHIAGTSNDEFIRLGITGDTVGIFAGSADPSGSLTAEAGSLYLRSTGALYLNTSGTTTWTTFSTGVTGSGANGRVAYWTGTSTLSGEADFFWDATNNRLGISTATPSYPIDVAFSTSSTTLGAFPSIRVRNTIIGGGHASFEASAEDSSFQNPVTVFLESVGSLTQAATGLQFGGVVGTRDNRPFFIAINGSDLVKFGTDGTIGVGLADSTSASYRLHMLYNTSNNNGIVLDQAGTGDGLLGFEVNGVRNWTVGWDNSDSDKFKIGQAALETNTAITITTGANPKIGFQTQSPTYPLHLSFSSTSTTLGTYPSILIENTSLSGNASIELQSKDTPFQVSNDVFLMSSGIIASAAETGLQAGGAVGTRANRPFFITLNGTDRVMFNTDNTIGVGLADNTAPSYRLHLLWSSTTNQGIVLDQSGTGDGLLGFEVNGTRKWTIGWDNSDTDKFKIGRAALETDTAITITDTTTTKIGFRTNAPTYPLHLSFSDTTNTLGTYPSLLIENTSLNGNASIEIQSKDTSFQISNDVFLMSSGILASAAETGLQAGGAVGTRANRPFFITLNGTDRVMFNTDNTIGVGLADNTTPSYRLHLLWSSTTNQGIVLDQSGTGDGILGFEINGTRNWTIGWDNSDSDKFKIGQAALETNTALTITTGSTPMIGIRTSTPTYPLHMAISTTSTTPGVYPSIFLDNPDIGGGLAGYELQVQDVSFQNDVTVFLMANGQSTFAPTGNAFGGVVGTRDNRHFFIATNNVDVAMFASNGRVGIGLDDGASPLGKLDVYQSSTVGAIPVLKLTQSDTSEEFIRFIGSATSANLTQSIVNAADVTTATPAGYVRVYIQDDGNQISDQAYYIQAVTLA